MTPQKATPRMQVAVWWRCAAGHEWEERISAPRCRSGRTAMSHRLPRVRRLPGLPHLPRVRAHREGAALAPFGQERRSRQATGRCSRRGPLGGARAGRRGDQRARRRTGTARSVNR
ncbi:zinc-ribbon domain-containing protein [Streptomyces sp. NPDC048637]|uniref:zinc-ribbon domain-containing protein n=1 Tax=Streptomyces sp. NPDC048637 TaxID=3155636 RepID=UPI0034150D1F